MLTQSGSLHTLNDTELLAQRIAERLKVGMSVALIGELGSGKTSLCRFIARARGVTTPVSSPTFVLCHEYPLPGSVMLEHWDLYRLDSLPEELGSSCDSHTIRLIEWADKFAACVARCDVIITLALQEDGTRQYTIETRA